ncbi:MAG: hypothetical protein COW42_14640 [Deltaproteobacteria bacterium CG17_big_fil_post_rev_8_21_14_2_50_63_7]|nr:MAG: hypothetical protein COW42_14640 [Deltaproteobacteria bacterium CG17_big_fil_post_rev_8_21_14_2_50_63_7]
MGQIIRAGAAREEIIKCGRDTLDAARQRDDAWKKPAEERLAPVLELCDGIAAEMVALGRVVQPLRQGIDMQNEVADDIIVRVVEQLFDLGGRRRNDPWLALLAPGGAGAYTDGPTDEQPRRMALFAKLLRKLGHKRIAKAETDAAADKIDTAAKSFGEAVAAAEQPMAELSLVERTLTALAKVVRMELVSLKQGWKAAGFSEAEIHRVIPDSPDAGSASTTTEPPPT